MSLPDRTLCWVEGPPWDRTCTTVGPDVERAVAERDDLRAAGDTLQSGASRIAEWFEQRRKEGMHVPDEVGMALLETQDAARDWTEIRKQATR